MSYVVYLNLMSPGSMSHVDFKKLPCSRFEFRIQGSLDWLVNGHLRHMDYHNSDLWPKAQPDYRYTFDMPDRYA